MGCETSSTASPAATTAPPSTTNVTNFAVIARQVKQTWPDVQKIDRLGAKTFAYLLHKYPELRSFYHIPEAYKTQADLLNAPEVKEAGEKFISFYSDIIENGDTKFDEILQEKAKELYGEEVRASQLKFYGESLVHVIKYELKDELNFEEKQAWQTFTNQVSNGLGFQLAKYPRKSIFQ